MGDYRYQSRPWLRCNVKASTQYYITQETDPDHFRVGRQHTILPTFPKNCLKSKEFGRPGGLAPPPPDPPMQPILFPVSIPAPVSSSVNTPINPCGIFSDRCKGGAGDALPPKFFHVHALFDKNFVKNYIGAPALGLASSWKSWIRH